MNVLGTILALIGGILIGLGLRGILIHYTSKHGIVKHGEETYKITIRGKLD